MTASCAAPGPHEPAGRRSPVREVSTLPDTTARPRYECSLRTSALERDEVTEKVADFLRRQLAAVRRHWRFVDERELLELVPHQRPKLLAVVDELHGEHVLVQQS